MLVLSPMAVGNTSRTTPRTPIRRPRSNEDLKESMLLLDIDRLIQGTLHAASRSSKVPYLQDAANAALKITNIVQVCASVQNVSRESVIDPNLDSVQGTTRLPL